MTCERLDLFARRAALRVVGAERVTQRYDPVGFGGLELFGRAPVMAGLIRPPR